MREFRLLVAAMLISSVIHLLILLGISTIKLPSFKKKTEKQIQVSYRAVKKKEPKASVEYKDIKVETRKEQAKLPVDIISKNFKAVPIFEQTPSKQASVLKLDKKVVPKMEMGDARNKVTIPYFKSEKISNPRYLSYNENIRHKIKQQAFIYANNLNAQVGEVYLAFIVRSDGVLKEVKIVEDKTKATSYLRDISLRSIKDSSPFPPFPKDLSNQELPFSIVISFEISQ